MAGGDEIGAEALGGGEEGVELDLAVAEDVRIGRPPAGVFVEHVVHDPLPIRPGQVHEIERNADLAGHQLSDEPVLLPLAVAVERRVGVVPVLHEHGEDVVPLLLEEQGGHGGVHSPAETDADLDGSVRIRLVAMLGIRLHGAIYSLTDRRPRRRFSMTASEL